MNKHYSPRVGEGRATRSATLMRDINGAEISSNPLLGRAVARTLGRSRRVTCEDVRLRVRFLPFSPGGDLERDVGVGALVRVLRQILAVDLQQHLPGAPAAES